MATSKKEESLLPVYLVVGEDALKRAAVLRRLRARVAEKGDLAFNSDEFDGEKASGADIAAACNTMPFASPVRLVAVHAAEKLKKADSEALVSYAASPSPTTVLALEAEKLAKNTRLYKAVAKVGKTAVIDCTPPKRHELPRMVRSMAVGHGVAFTEGAAAKLVELVGEDTVRLDNEVSKVALAHRGTDPVSEHEVMTLVSRTAEVKPWEFVDAFSARDLKKCLWCLNRMESSSPYSLIAQCVNRLRELICARSLCERGAQGSLASVLKMPAWRCKNHVAWARGFSATELRQALVSARDAERAMKSGSDPDAAFLDWVLSVVPRQRGR